MTYIYFFALLTVIVLIVGIIFMAIGGKLNKKMGTKLMTMRVVFQALAIIALALLYYSNRK